MAKCLLNVDRNSSQHNAILFGVPEDVLLLRRNGAEDVVAANNNSQKLKELLKVVEFNGNVKQHIRLGAAGDRPRPIKVIFNSPSEANSAISNSGKLKKLANQKVFLGVE